MLEIVGARVDLLAVLERLNALADVGVDNGRRHLVLHLGELGYGRLGRRACHARIHHRGQEGHRRHDRIARLAERYGLIGERTESTCCAGCCCARSVGRLQVRILDGQLEELEYALVLGARADVLAHLVPVVAVHLDALEQRQQLLVAPVRVAQG